MNDEVEQEEIENERLAAGQWLRSQREAKNMTLEDVAESTRVPLRQLQNLEDGEFDRLPGNTYVIGFTRSYATAVGIPSDEAVQRVRDEIDYIGKDQYYAAPSGYEPADPSRVPPKAFAWGAVAILAALLIAYFVVRGFGFGGTEDFGFEEDQPVAESSAKTEAKDKAEAAKAADANGTVKLSATGNVWLRIDDGDERLYEGVLSEGESYDVPSDAENPLITTGRPEALDVTVDGKKVETLGPARTTVTDVSLKAASLLGRSDQADEESADDE